MTGFSCKMTNSIRVKTYKIITNKKRGIGKKKFYAYFTNTGIHFCAN